MINLDLMVQVGDGLYITTNYIRSPRLGFTLHCGNLAQWTQQDMTICSFFFTLFSFNRFPKALSSFSFWQLFTNKKKADHKACEGEGSLFVHLQDLKAKP
jgi:hypothetical protein